VLFAIDRDGIFTHSEGKGLEALALRPSDVVGRSVWDLYENRPDILAHVRRALSGEAHTAIVRIGDTAFETRYAPFHDRDGGVDGVIGVAIDVTERQRSRPSAPPKPVIERCSSGISRAFSGRRSTAGSSSATSRSRGSSASPHPTTCSSSPHSTSTCGPRTGRRS
jgi:PAS domain S-box-containing protein